MRSMLVIMILMIGAVDMSAAFIKHKYDLCKDELVSCGVANACMVVFGSKSIVCWGDNSYAQSAPPLAEGDYYRFVSCAEKHCCGIKNDLTLFCWGYGGRGDNRLVIPPAPDWPRQSRGGFRWKATSVGNAYSCAIMNEDRLQYKANKPVDQWGDQWLEAIPSWVPANQTLLCWGNNSTGAINFPLSNLWSTLSSGAFHVCGIRLDTNGLYCWGGNWTGQAVVETTNTWVRVAAGYSHTCAINSNGIMSCWGDGRSGQLNPPCSTLWLRVCAGQSHTCGVSQDHSIICWGSNEFGEANSPAAITDFIDVSCGRSFTCGVRSNYQVLCWGLNNFGQSTPSASYARQCPDIDN